MEIIEKENIVLRVPAESVRDYLRLGFVRRGTDDETVSGIPQGKAMQK